MTWVERNFGYAIARAYAGHTIRPAITTYIKADLQAVATAPAALTGQPISSRPALRISAFVPGEPGDWSRGCQADAT